MIVKRWNQDRGRTKTGWLDSRHTFSFGSYFDPEQMGFRALRVINDDRVIPGAGFATHAHEDMEIISYVMYRLPANRCAWLHVAQGLLKLNEHDLRTGDGAAITNEELLKISTEHGAEFLLFDLP